MWSYVIHYLYDLHKYLFFLGDTLTNECHPEYTVIIYPPFAAEFIKIYVRFKVFSAMTMKNVIFWDIKTQFVPHRRHITSPLQSPAG
jgi:hypothetical protein